jgi:hypothetical protein
MRRTSNTAPWQEEQQADGGIDGQLKVGPTRRVPVRAPPTNGESRTSVILVQYIDRNVETSALK